MRLETLPWYYAPSPLQPGEQVTLAGEEWHHCSKVLRYSTGDKVILTNGQGQCTMASILTVHPREGTLIPEEDVTDFFHFPKNYTVSIGLSPTKNIDRTEFAVEKLTELGVDEIIFLQCKHGERRQIRIDRMEKIMVSAAKQSRKAIFPRLMDMQDPVSLAKEYASHTHTDIYCCHLDEKSLPLSKKYTTGRNVMLLIGPEGGFAEDEVSRLKDLGAHAVSIGSYRLRVETAAITACAQIHLMNEINNNA